MKHELITPPKTRAAAQRLSRARRLEFVVTFVRLHLRTLRPGDWLNLREDLMAFLTGFSGVPDADSPVFARGDVLAHPTDPPTSDTFTREAFAQLQAEVLQFLEDLILMPGDVGCRLGDAVAVQGVTLGLLANAQGYTHLVIEGTTRDLFFWVLALLLKDDQWQAIVRCAACGTVFYRYKGQMYCSKTCVNRVTQQRWRDRHAHATAPEDDQTPARMAALDPVLGDPPEGTCPLSPLQSVTTNGKQSRAPGR
jgi:hypothetical protein